MSDVKRYDVTEKYIGTGEYVGAMEESATGDWVAFSDYAPLKARLAEAERKLSCGCHHSLDDSYGGCVLHITLRSHAELEEESERLQARLAEAVAALHEIAHAHDSDARRLRLMAADALIRHNTTDSASVCPVCNATSGKHYEKCPRHYD